MSQQQFPQSQLALAAPSTSDPDTRPDLNITPPPCPSALASYQQVVADADIFMTTLQDLHTTMGTKFLVPILGRKPLNLHQLFIEVTTRGGLEKVISDRKWKEIINVLNFPPTTTSASYALRKYYVSLLQPYEQLYFFRTQDLLAPLEDVTHVSPEVQLALPARPKRNKTKNRPISSSELQASSSLPSGSPLPTSSPLLDCSSLPTGHSLTGIIDEKFECGYLVTVNFGSEKLKGILYQVPDESQQRPPAAGASPSVVKRRRRRRKSQVLARDPSHSKPNRKG